MDVIIMQSTIQILKQLKDSYPQYSFKKSSRFYWSGMDKTIYYDISAKDSRILLLHELSHALLNHTKYDSDVQLLAMERQAWDHTIDLAKPFNISVSDDIIQSALDSYRDWLHARSTCPKCSATGMQTDAKTYKCSACNNIWQVNEARTCALRRYNKKRT